MQCPPAATLRDRIYQVLGERPDLIELFRESAGTRHHRFRGGAGRAGTRSAARSTSSSTGIVRDRSLQHAITDAYSTATIRERSPEVHLFLGTGAGPRRRERPPDQGRGPVSRAGAGPTKCCGGRSWTPWLDPAVPSLRFGSAGAGIAMGGGGLGAFREGGTPGGGGVPSLPGVFGEPVGAGALLARDGLAVAMTVAGPGTDPWTHAPLGVPDGGRLAAGEQRAAGLVDRRGAVDPVRPMVPLGQLRDTFIIAIDSEGLLIVDQHVAHERILYEQVLRAPDLLPPREPAAADCRWVLDLSPDQGRSARRPRRRSGPSRLRGRAVRRSHRPRSRRCRRS